MRATLYFDKQMADLPPRLDVCEFMPLWFLYVCLSKIQIFIKTASMIELTMFSIQEQACIPYPGVISKEQGH